MNWKKITQISALKDLTAIGTANVVGSGISGIFWFYLAALIGTDGYGELSYLLAIVGIISAVASIGSGYTTIVYTAKNINILPATFTITIIGSVYSKIRITSTMNKLLLFSDWVIASENKNWIRPMPVDHNTIAIRC